MKNRPTWKTGAVQAALLLSGAFALPALADGNETLGNPSVVLASGSGFVAKGVGLAFTQPGTISFSVPVGATVKQVLLYWEGQSIDLSPDPADDTIRVEGIEVTGTAIGGPTLFYQKDGGNVSATAFRTDITSLNLVHAGANSLEVADLNFSFANDGAGVLVVFDNGTTNTLQLRDGEDLAFRDFAPPLDGTVPQTFTFPAAAFNRTADLSMFFASVVGPLSGNGPHRPNSIEITVGGGTVQGLSDPLGSADGAEWDTKSLSVQIPAGATSLTVQAFSRDDLGSGDLPASLAWIGSALSIAPPSTNVCPATDPSGTPIGALSTTVDANGDVTVILDQNRDNANDNSYGANIVNWPRSRAFSALVGSDKAQFVFKNGLGATVFDFYLDYISVKSGTPAGYGSLGANGGDGRVNSGQLSWLLDWHTSLDQNLNDHGFCSGGNCTTHGVNLLVDSPPANSNYVPNDPFFNPWNFDNIYTVKVSHLAFGGNGFGSAEVTFVHNSPSKGFEGAIVPCVPGGGGSGNFCTSGMKPKALTMQYTGQSCSATNNSQAADKQKCTGDPMAASPVRILVTNKSNPTDATAKVWFNGSVSLNGQLVISATNAGRTKLDKDTYAFVYMGTTLKQSIKLHTSCSQPLKAGDQFGSLKLIAFTPE